MQKELLGVEQVGIQFIDETHRNVQNCGAGEVTENEMVSFFLVFLSF